MGKLKIEIPINKGFQKIRTMLARQFKKDTLKVTCLLIKRCPAYMWHELNLGLCMKRVNERSSKFPSSF